MYTGRDFTELSMTKKTDWTNEELFHFHHSFQQLLPYLNAEGLTIYRELLEEMHSRPISNDEGISLHVDPTVNPD